jgi:hypothetical protein
MLWRHFANCRKSRGPADNPGASGQFADVPLHAGLICIDGPDGMTAEVQSELFEAVLDEIRNVSASTLSERIGPFAPFDI